MFKHAILFLSASMVATLTGCAGGNAISSEQQLAKQITNDTLMQQVPDYP